MRITDRLAIVAAVGALLLLAIPDRAGADPADVGAPALDGRGVAPADRGFVQVPEPTTALTLGLGLAVLAAHRRRERRSARGEPSAIAAGGGWRAHALSDRPTPRPSPPRPGAGRPASGA